MVTLLSVLVSRVSRSQAVRLVLIGSACLLAGAGAFSATQHVSYGTGLYWAITTATTVGYGDVTPKNAAGRAVAAAVMLTTIPLFASAFAMFAGAVAATHLRRLLGVAHHEGTGREVVILGFHPTVPRIARELLEAGREVVVVASADSSSLPEAVHLVHADPTTEDGVRRGRPERAAQLLVTGSSDADVLVTAVLVHQLAPEVPSVAVAHSGSVVAALRELGIATAVSGEDLLAHTLAKSLEAPHAGELLLRLVTSDGYRLKEVSVEAALEGRPLSSVRAERDGLVLGLVHDGQVTVGVSQDPTVGQGDRLLVLEPQHSR